MRDLLHDKVAVQRMALVSRLVSVGDCDHEEKTIALDWLAELSEELLDSLLEAAKKNPHSGGSDSGLLQ